jgi:hypothetical protein
MNSKYKSRLVRSLLSILGVAGIVVGMAIILIAYFYIGPKLERVARSAGADLRSADSALASIEAHPVILASVPSLLNHSSKLASLVPETLLTTQGLLIEASSSLSVTATAANETSSGVAGLVLPKNTLGKDTLHLRNTSEQMRLLSSMLGEIQGASAPMARSLSAFSDEAARLIPTPGTARALVHGTRARLVDVAGLLEGMSPRLAMLGASALFGGMYILLGAISLILAMALPGPASAEAFGRITEEIKRAA